ncbi:olfactory receptor 6B1-like [Bombina bombina]|uniref:olfactory receptor 6B1-like n=1 Tax=Bombina bombina TaxID=8345 RepID=UPI00235AD688|nr:olfactory receptor 6B1-like [Bombina bombina]
MTLINQSQLTEFILIGFPSNKNLQVLLFMVFLSFYILTVTTNVFIIGTVSLDPKLKRSPMYVFLSHFSFLEIWYTTVTIPKMLVDFTEDTNTISHSGCIVQIYFFFSLGLTELFFLAAMAYDRYLAICHPLRYNSLMTSKLCNQLSILSWLCGFFSSFLLVIPSSRLLFCGPNTINHFFCDFIPLLNISCTEIFIIDKIFYSIAWIIILYSFLLTITSYYCIIMTIYRLPFGTGRKKAFSTCVSHLTVVLTFYGTIIFMYIRPSKQYAFNIDKVVSIFYAVVIPLLNPLVYTIRNREVKKAMRNMIMKNCIS